MPKVLQFAPITITDHAPVADKSGMVAKIRHLAPYGAALALMAGIAWYATRRRGRKSRKNPLSSDPEKAYKQFHWGKKASKTKAVAVSPAPAGRLVELGTLEAVTYSADKNDGLVDYFHEFGRKKPVLALDPKTNRLHIVGGGYVVEDRGIVG